MKFPHFFKVSSRMGLLHPPIYTKKLNIGVEKGPEAILTSTFLGKFSNSNTTSFEFPAPDSIPSKTFLSVFSEETTKLKNVIMKNLKSHEVQVVIGGDHTVTLPSVLAVMDRLRQHETLGYIQFDSHGDINLYASSITKNLHGMYVRPLVDTFDVKEIDKLVPHKLPTTNMRYIGNLYPYLDPEEKDFFKKKKIVYFDKKALTQKKEETIKAFETFISQFDHLHITFDIDCLDKSIAPATGLPAEDGLLLEDVDELLTLVSKHPSFSFDLVEVNPEKPGARKTVETAQTILKRVLL
jgi:arginase